MINVVNIYKVYMHLLCNINTDVAVNKEYKRWNGQPYKSRSEMHNLFCFCKEKNLVI